MKIEIYNCDRCGKEWDLKHDAGAYTMDHVSLNGDAIMGDNRITRQKIFCRDCFGQILPYLSNTP